MAFKDEQDEKGTWQSYEKLVLHELKRLGKSMDYLMDWVQKTDRDLEKLKSEIKREITDTTRRENAIRTVIISSVIAVISFIVNKILGGHQ